MKAYRFAFILMVVIIAFPLAGRLFWIMKKSKTIKILIINKSAETTSRNEVKSLNWTLNFEKIVKSDGKIYDFKSDYLGFFPDAMSDNRRIQSFKLEEISSLAQSNDALFFIDNSGIKTVVSGKKTLKPLTYGGFNQNDYFLLKEMLGRQKLVVAEYNFFSPPTEDLVRYNTERLLDIYSLGWNGRFFTNLEKEKNSGEIPAGWLDLYKQNYSSEWNFTGPGIILLNKGQNRILVLPSSTFMNAEYPEVITSPEIAMEYNIPSKVSYAGWFELTYEGKNKVISHLNLNLNQEGIDLLKKNGFEPEFPAVIESVNKKFYYMTGDFSKAKVFLPASRLGFISSIYVGMAKMGKSDPDNFFRDYYNLLLTDILNDYYSEISGPGDK